MSVKKCEIKTEQYKYLNFVDTKLFMRGIYAYKIITKTDTYEKEFINVKRRHNFNENISLREYGLCYNNPVIEITYFKNSKRIKYCDKNIDIDISNFRLLEEMDRSAKILNKVRNIIISFEIFLLGVLLYKRFIKK